MIYEPHKINIKTTFINEMQSNYEIYEWINQTYISKSIDDLLAEECKLYLFNIYLLQILK